MASYYLAPSLAALRNEVDQRWPDRDKASDGWIGDPAHSARVSDHNPDWSSTPPGVVRALDIDVDGINVRRLLTELIGDPRAWYVIYNRVIYSRTYDWAAHAYTGSNPHDKHVHVSLMHTHAAEIDTRVWLGERKPARVRGLPLVDLSDVAAQFERGGTVPLPGVRRVQRALNGRYRVGLTVDGIAGGSTRQAYRQHEHAIAAPHRDGVPGRTSLVELARGRFRVVD